MIEPAILDTDVLSYIVKNDTRAALYLPLFTDKQLCVSFQTVAELRLWTLVRQWGLPRRKDLESRLEHFVVLPYDSILAQHWADITAHRRRLGRPIECGDAWIAASAVRHSATLYSHNASDFANIPDLKLISRGN